jgi:signal transduction histidine kinase
MIRLASRSILSRIAWLQILALGAAYAVMLVCLQLVLDQTTMAFQRKTLRAHEEPIAQGLNYGPAGWSVALPEDLRSIYASHYGGFAFSIVDGQGRVLTRSAPARLHFKSARLDPQAPSYFRQRVGGSVYYGATFPEHRGPATAWIEIAQDIDNPDVVFDDIMHAFVPRMAWLFGALLVLLVVVDVFIIRRGLRPVLEASQRAKSIGPATISMRLPDAHMPTEIAPLVHAINQALDRLESGFVAQREFTADAAHEIRTPLAVLRVRIDSMEDRDTAKALKPYIDAMGHIVDQLLAIAELESVAIEPDDRVDLQRVCVRTAELLAPAAASQDKAIGMTGVDAPVWAHGRDDLVFQAVRNLAQNALAHTARATAVQIEVVAPASVRVVDAGPGVPEEQRELIFRRFWRRDRRRSDGAGLGLAIVARIVKAHGGSVTVGSAPNGGAVFQIDLMPAPAPERGA